MVTMGNVWDRTTEVLGGRSGILARIAILFVLLPSVVQDAFVAYSPPDTMSFVAVGGVISIAVLVLMIWGQLVILAVATDPATNFADGVAQGRGRLGAAIVVTIVLMIAILIAIVPLSVALVMGGIDLSALRAGTMPILTPGVAGFLSLYTLVLAIAVFLIGARLILVNPAVLNERRSVGALRRSFELTRGLTWRLIGVMLLFIVVVVIASGAAQMVAGVVFRLALGEEGRTTTQFLAGVASTIVTTIFTVVAAAFSAQLYVAIAGQPVRGATDPA